MKILFCEGIAMKNRGVTHKPRGAGQYLFSLVGKPLSSRTARARGGGIERYEGRVYGHQPCDSGRVVLEDVAEGDGDRSR